MDEGRKKNEKIISLVAVICLILCVFTLASCGKDPLEKFYGRMDRKGEFRMEMEMTTLGITVKQTIENDGKISYTDKTVLNSEYYTYETEEGVQKYVCNPFGTWVRSDFAISEEDEIFNRDMDAVFNPENFDIVDNVYTQKSDVTFESFSDVKVTLEDKNVCVIEMVVTEDGMEIDTKLTITIDGDIKLELPEDYKQVSVSLGQSEAYDALYDEGYKVTRVATGVTVNQVLASWGISDAEVHVILVAQKEEESIILVYCEDNDSAQSVCNGLDLVLESTMKSTEDYFGKDSDEYQEAYEQSKNSIVGADGLVVCMASSEAPLNIVK